METNTFFTPVARPTPCPDHPVSTRSLHRRLHMAPTHGPEMGFGGTELPTEQGRYLDDRRPSQASTPGGRHSLMLHYERSRPPCEATRQSVYKR
jgi:hypothetical protein